jgi:hypothetical protein
MLITIAVVLFVVLSYAIYIISKEPLSFVSISINPDVELAVNDNGIVKEVIPINEDADVITSNLDLVGMNIEDASDEIIDAAIETGYIDEFSDENTVVVTTTNEDEELRSDLEDKVTTSVNKRLAEKNIYGIVITNGLNAELKAEAEQYDISNGKMLLVNRAVTVNPTLSKEDLATMSVKEIQQGIKAYVAERHEALKTSRSELKTKWQQEKATLIQTTKSKIEKAKDDLLDAANINTDNMTEQEKNNAITEVVKNKKNEFQKRVNMVKAELEKTTEAKVYPAIKDTIRNIRERVKKTFKEEE